MSARRKARQGDRIILRRLNSLLRSFPSTPPSKQDRGALRAEVRRLAEAVDIIRTLSRSRLLGLSSSRSARDRICAYLTLFVGEIVDARELHVVGGIQEATRRIRELRVQFGYSISTGYSREDLRPDQYVLENLAPNADEAAKWRTANAIRKRKGSVKSRILALLRAHLGKPVTTELVGYVSKGADKRRVRELRTQDGWRVVTRQSGRPDLPANVYVLESEGQLPPHDRRIPDRIYDAVLVRDRQCCRFCGWSVDQRLPRGRKQFLEVHHIEHHRDGGANNQDNLITLCNVDHDEVHRQHLSGAAFWKWLSDRAR